MVKKKINKPTEKLPSRLSLLFPPRLVSALADEVAKVMIKRIPALVSLPKRRPSRFKTNKMENAVFLDTSAIIDGRIFGAIELGLFSSSTIVVLESILLELKHIADSRDNVKRERGRYGLELLEKIKKIRGIKLVVVPDNEINEGTKDKEVDEKLISGARAKKGRIVTCDYNLAKKASVEGILAININTLANILKIRSVPGESFSIKILHRGREKDQGVGYLDDGTMLVVEEGAQEVGSEISVVVTRVIQTAAGRILFSKKI